MLTRLLDSKTGIFGFHLFVQGLTWEKLRKNAMKLVAPFDSIVVDLDEAE